MKVKRVANKFIKHLRLVSLPLILVFSLTITPRDQAEAVNAQVPYSFFLENPYIVSGVRGNLEVVSVDGGGVLIMNQLRADVNLFENIFGIYTRFPFAGVTSGVFGKGDYSFGNIGLGTKYAVFNLNNTVLTLGFELLLPTAGNNNGSLGARSYFRDFASFAVDAWTLAPYGVFAISGDIFAFQANLDFDIITNAKRADQSPFDTGGDDTELIIKYGATASVTPSFNLPLSVSFILETLMASSTTFNKNVTGAYLTPGVRFEGQVFSFGAGIQVPFGSSEINNFANIDILADMTIRFGG